MANSRASPRGLVLSAAAALALLACAAPPRGEPFEFLHVVPTRVDPAWDSTGALQLAVEAKEPARLEDALAPEAIVRRSPRELVVRLDPYPGRLAAPEARHLESSFLVDFDSQPVQALIDAHREEARPTPAELVEWTRSAIEPTYERDFDAASVIVRVGRGDCTEHAVLFSALARSFGYPTRIAIGLVLVVLEGEFQAFGHAWTEILLDGAWQLVDPTLVEDAISVGYLPLGYLGDEGPGYSLDLVRIRAAQVREVRVVAGPPPE